MPRPPARLWLAGGRGLLGGALAEAAAARGLATWASGQAVDITRPEALWARAADEHRAWPLLGVVNCAAWTAVDACEADPRRAFRVNALGAGHLAQVAARLGLPALHVSSDYVLGTELPAGAGEDPERCALDEAAPCQPGSAYGLSKWAGEALFEDAMAAAGVWSAVVRTSWLFGSSGRSFVDTMLANMRAARPLRVVDDQWGRPTFAPDLAAAILALMGLDGGARGAGGLFHFANAGATTWYRFAREIRALALAAGLLSAGEGGGQLTAVTSAEMPRPARRPGFSVLATDKLTRALGSAPRPWREGLVERLGRGGGRPGRAGAHGGWAEPPAARDAGATGGSRCAGW